MTDQPFYQEENLKTFPAHRFSELQSIIDADQDDRQGKNILGEELNYGILQHCCEGQLFWLEDKGKIVAFALCIENFEKDKFTQKIIDTNFSHDYWYLKDLAAIGKFVYIKQIVVHPDFRLQKKGTYLSEKIQAYYQQNDGPILIGSVIQVDNLSTINFFKAVLGHFMFIDYYKSPKTKEVIWHRVVNILDKRKFFKSINSEKLTKAFRTIIPIQLNLTTRSINALFEKLQSPAEILWSSFFQLDEMMEREYGMQNVYNGYYQSLLNSTESKNGQNSEAFDKVKRTLNSLINYLVQKDKHHDGEEGVASLSESMRNKAYDFFLVNLGKETEVQPFREYFQDFGRPVVVNIDTLNLPNLASNKEIGIISYPDPGNTENEVTNTKLFDLLNRRNTRSWKPTEQKQLEAEYNARLFTENEKKKIELILEKERLYGSEAGIWKHLLKKQALSEYLSNSEKEKWAYLIKKKFAGDPLKEKQAIEATANTKMYEKDEKRRNDLRKLIFQEGSTSITLREEFESLEKSQEAKEGQYLLEKAFLEEFRVEQLSSDEKEFRQNLLGRLPVSNPERWDSWLQLHHELYEADRLANKDLASWCHAVVPISFSGGLIGVMFTFIIKEKNNAPAPVDSELMELINFLAITISNALSKNIFNIHLKLRNGIIEKYLRQFAVSSVMARNMSHNLGSHVLSRISTKKGIMQPLASLHPQADDFLETQLTYLASFNHTLRTRMDFLADISTTRPVAAVPMKFKKDIIDNFRQENVILKYISGTDAIIINISFHPDYKEDIDIQVPNGHLGRQAFYIILENIIRNCAKHETIPLNAQNIPELKLCIRREKIEHNEELDDRNYRILIYDNIARKNKKLVNDLNINHINTPIIYQDKIRPFGWGMLEMKIAAAYLRKEAPANIDKLKNTENQLELLKAREIPLEDEGQEGYYLGFELFLKKPRELLIIDSGNYFEKLADHEATIKRGIRIIDKDSISRSTSKEEAFTHEITMLLGKANRKQIEQKKILPLRWLHLETPEDIRLLQEALILNEDNLLLEIWKKWLRQFIQNKRLPNSSYQLIMDDDMLDPKSNLAQTILFDIHYEKFSTESFQLNDLAYYEAYSNNSKTGKLLQYMPINDDLAYERLELEIIEAALTEVAVLDERVQHELEQQIGPHRSAVMTSKDISIYQELEWMKIYIPSTDKINLNSESFTAAQKEIFRTWISERMKLSELDFIIIHIGILEKMFGSSPRALDDFINFLGKQNDRTEIVLTSGRGRPHYIPKKTLFIHYSNLAHYLFEERSKFHFVKLLFSARHSHD